MNTRYAIMTSRGEFLMHYREGEPGRAFHPSLVLTFGTADEARRAANDVIQQNRRWLDNAVSAAVSVLRIQRMIDLDEFPFIDYVMGIPTELNIVRVQYYRDGSYKVEGLI